MKRFVAWIVIVCALFMGGRADAETLKAGYVSKDLNYLPFFIAQKKGFYVLADVAALGLAYQHQGGVTTRKYLREHPDVVRNFVKSYIEAVHRLKTDRANLYRRMRRLGIPVGDE